MSTSARRRLLVCLSASVLALAGCAADVDTARPVDVATERLREAVPDQARISGFSINPAAVTLVAGEPPARQVLHRFGGAADEAGESTPDPTHPLTVPNADFPLDDSLRRAKELSDGCADATIDVQALGAGVVTTSVACEGDGEDTVLLGDRTLEGIDEPISADAVTQLWSEVEEAGLAERIVLVEIDAEADVARVQFPGTDLGRTYEWVRGLGDVDSVVQSYPNPAGTTLDLASYPADEVGAALDELVATVDDPARVARAQLAPDPDGGGARLVLTAADHTELASATLDGL
jgi:hypothetical protein